jgi:cytochrome P450
VGVSSAFILRTLIKNPDVLSTLKASPALARDEHVIMELLRRDNHVKALSRQATTAFQLERFPIEAGELIYLYFPGVNMDPGHWNNPLKVDLDRKFTGENNIIFGGSFYTCIGRKLTMAFLGNTIEGFIRYLSPGAAVLEDEIDIDGSWMAERILTRMPVRLAGREHCSGPDAPG